MTEHIERLQRYLDRFEKDSQYGKEHIHGFDVGAPSEAVLRASDIRAVISRVSELESQLESIGAGGVERLRSGSVACEYPLLPEPSIRHLLYKCREFIDTTKVPAYPAGADLADEIDRVLALPTPKAAPPDWWRKRADEIELQVAQTGSTEAATA